MSLVFDIVQGAGLAGATGVRPYLPPLLAGALARADAGIDFEGGDFAFLESTGFLLAVLGLTVVAVLAERRRGGREGAVDPRAERGRSPLETALFAAALVIGALLFAGAFTGDGGERSGLAGLPLGVVCALLGYLALATLFARARRRAAGGAAGLLTLYADGIALGLAALSIFLPPVGLVALVAFAVLALRARGAAGQKYEGLRILR